MPPFRIFTNSQAQSLAAMSLEVRQGVCAAMCYDWICEQLRTPGASYVRHLYGGLPQRVISLQRGLSAILLRSGSREQTFRQVARGDRLTMQWWNWENPPGALLVFAISEFVDLHRAAYNRGLAMLGLFGPAAGHWVAMCVQAGNLTYFDPNDGEWAFSTYAEFLPWLDAELTARYSNLPGIGSILLHGHIATFTGTPR
jgi:hypothetical protein